MKGVLSEVYDTIERMAWDAVEKRIDDPYLQSHIWSAFHRRSDLVRTAATIRQLAVASQQQSAASLAPADDFR